MLTTRAAAVFSRARVRPVQSRQGCNVKQQAGALLGHDHRRQPALQRVTEFQEAVGPGTGDVGEDHATAMQLGENLLVGVLVRAGWAFGEGGAIRELLAIPEWPV